MPWAVYYANILYAWPFLAAYIEQLDLLIHTVGREDRGSGRGQGGGGTGV